MFFDSFDKLSKISKPIKHQLEFGFNILDYVSKLFKNVKNIFAKEIMFP